MTDAERNIVDLWVALHGEPPPVSSDVTMMVRALVEGLQEPSRVIEQGFRPADSLTVRRR